MVRRKSGAEGVYAGVDDKLVVYLKSMANGAKMCAPAKAASAVIALYEKTNSLRPLSYLCFGGQHRAERCNAEVLPQHGQSEGVLRGEAGHRLCWSLRGPTPRVSSTGGRDDDGRDVRRNVPVRRRITPLMADLPLHRRKERIRDTF